MDPPIKNLPCLAHSLKSHTDPDTSSTPGKGASFYHPPLPNRKNEELFRQNVNTAHLTCRKVNSLC